jgi:hypothetical protein
MEPEEEELRKPREGITSMGIAFTLEMGRKIMDGVRRLAAEGWSETRILAKMREDVHGFSPHTLKRLYDMATGKPIRDDFQQSEIVSQKATAKHTFELELLRTRPEIPVGSIVRFMGGDWFIKRTVENRIIIRRFA